MNGTTQYYTERFMTNVMNRLVENETITIADQYELYKEEINNLEKTTEVKEVYLNNLNQAYERVQLSIKGEEEELVLHG